MRILAVALMLPVVVGCGLQGTTQSPPPAQYKLWDEDELAKAVQGKTPEQVVVVMGRPADSSDGEALKHGERAYMTYKGTILDKYSGKPVDAKIRFFYGAAMGQGHVR